MNTSSDPGDVQPLDLNRGSVFALQASGQSLFAYGMRNRLEAGPAATLAARAEGFFATMRDGPALLVGALPFDRDEPDFLFQPDYVTSNVPFAGRRLAGIIPSRRISAQPDAGGYAGIVRRALEMIDKDGLRKVVLARALKLEMSAPLDPFAIAARLAEDPNVATFVTSLDDGRSNRRHTLVGATPELLVSKDASTVFSHPLAGSSRRFADRGADQESARFLERSDKDRREHALVVEFILDILAPYCSELSSAGEPSLCSTATMWHLGTPITGTLKDAQVSSAELAAALHPTPAVCGYPLDRARRAITEIEAQDRGFYAGALGWTEVNGDGRWYVTLRCAEIMGQDVSLFAGAGIVAGSDPEAEAAETSAKLQTILRALGLDEQGRAPLEAAQ